MSLSAKLDGMMWTMMIARETGEAVVVMEPYGLLTLAAINVAHRADVGTDTALHASLFHDVEALVGDEHMFKESTYYVSEEPRKRTFRKMADASLAFSQVFADGFQLLCSLLLLALLLLGRIYIHEWQTHIRLWHDERISRVGLADAHCLQLMVGLQTFVECFDRFPDAIACRADSKTERFAVGREVFIT